MVTLGVAMMFCMLLVVFPLNLGATAQKLAFPFKLDASSNPTNGESRIHSLDDINTRVSLTKSLKFWDKDFKDFYISPNGIIRTQDDTNARVDPWSTGGKTYDILVFKIDVKACPTNDKTCGIFWRFGRDTDTLNTISKIVRNGNLDKYLLKGQKSQIPILQKFEADPDRTLVVTWHKVPSFADHSKRNTFQAVITANKVGNTSYVIMSYHSFTYPGASENIKAGVVYNTLANNCQVLPPSARTFISNGGDKDNLLCQSNVYQSGVFLLGLSQNTHPYCTNKLVKASCAKCQKTAINVAANEGACPAISNPICGTNGKGYTNMCQLRKTACNNFDGTVAVKNTGSCYVDPCKDAGCEDKCIVQNGKARCTCSNGKRLRPDGKACDYELYFYQGSRNMLSLTKGNITEIITTQGDVQAVTHDYATNTLLFSTEFLRNNVMEYEIKSYNAKAKRIVTILNKSQTGGRVTHMMFDPADKTLYYATSDGWIKSIANPLGGVTPVVKHVMKFRKVAGINGEACDNSMFVLDSLNGTVSMFNQKTSIPKAVVKGLKNPSGFAVDHMNHKLYWYSPSNGFEESNFDGSCRRKIVAKGAQFKAPHSLFFFYNKLYWTDGQNQGSLYEMNPKDAHVKVSYSGQQPLYGIGMIYPSETWSERKINLQDMQPKVRAMRTMSNLKKEFRIKFTFKANKLNGSMDVFGFNTSDGTRLLEVKFDNKTNNFTVSIMASGVKKVVSILFTEQDKSNDHIFEIGVEVEGGRRRFYTRMNNRLVNTQTFQMASNLGNITVVGGAKLRQVGFFFKVAKPFCPVKYSCGDKCQIKNGGCEETCIPGAKGHRCQCTGGKIIKSDGVSCSWKGYFVVGGDHYLYISNGWITHPVAVNGKVTAVAYDYSSNSIFYALELKGNYSIHTYQPKENHKTKVDNSRLKRKVTQMMYDSKNLTIYFSTDDGKIHTLKELFGSKQAVMSELIKNIFTTVNGIAGENCNNNLLVLDSGKGEIYVFNTNTSWPYKPIIAGLKNARGITIDYYRHLMYWYSDMGIEESKFDGSCRRVVVKPSAMWGGRPHSMVFADALYWTNENLYKGMYSVFRTDINTGISAVISNNKAKFFGITFIWPDKQWVSQVTQQDIKKSLALKSPLPKVFKMKFMYHVQSTHDILDLGDNASRFDKPGLTVVYPTEGGKQNFTIPTEMNKKYDMEIVREMVGPNVYLRILMDGKVMFSVINNVKNLRTSRISVISKNMAKLSAFTKFSVLRQGDWMTCKGASSKICAVYCSASPCEDTCTRNITHPGYDRCTCSDGKGVQGDRKSCDWNYYMYMGGDKWITMTKTGKKTLTIAPKGKVVSIDHDYRKNLLFYSVEVGMKPNRRYHIRSYHPKHQFRTIINDTKGRPEHFSYDPFNASMQFSVNNSLKSVMNIHGGGGKKAYVHNLHNFTHRITGMEGEPCNKTLFVATADGAITQMGTNIFKTVVTGLSNVKGLTIDYDYHKLYWFSDNGLQESNYDGTCRRTIMMLGEAVPHDQIHLAGRLIMWSNTKNNSVASTHVDTGVTTYYPSGGSLVTAAGLIFNRHTYPSTCPIKSKCSVQFCNNNNGGCEETCTTVAGRAKCSCSSGKMRADQKTCDYSNFMIYASNQSIMLASSKKIVMQYAQGGEVHGVDFNYKKNHIFYTYRYLHGGNYMTQIRMFNARGVHKVMYNHTGANDVIQRLSYDPVNMDMYFSTPNKVHVLRNIYNHSKTPELVKSGNNTGFFFDPCKQKVYLLCTDSNSLQVWHKTSGLTTIKANLKDPRALAADLHREKLFFFSGKKIMEMNFNGNCNITEKELDFYPQPYGFQVYLDTGMAYWTDQHKHADGYYVYNYTISTGMAQVAFKSMTTKYHEITGIYDRKMVSSQPTCGKANNNVCSECGNKNGFCESKCYYDYTKSQKRCGCPYGYLKKDGRTCDFSNFTIYAVNSAIVASDGKQIFTVLHSGEALGVESDYGKNTVFYSVKNQIYTFDTTGKPKHLHTLNGFGNIERLALDVKTKDMYFLTKNYLHVIRNVYNQTITSKNITYFGLATGLAFDHCSKNAYVTCAKCKMLFKINGEDGKKVTILKDLNNPRAVSIDLYEQKLYYFEEGKNGGQITQVKYDGTCRHTVTKGLKDYEVYGLQVYSMLNYMLWTDVKKKSDGKYRVMKTTMKGENSVTYQDKYLRRDMKTIMNRKIAQCDIKNQKMSKCVLGGCRYNNGGCEDKCIYKDGKHSCSCTRGKLRPDMKGCDYSGIFINAVGNAIQSAAGTIKFPTEHETNAVEFDADMNKVYYSQYRSTGLRQGYFNELDLKTQKHTTLFTITPAIKHLAYGTRRIMYFTTYYTLQMVDLKVKKATPSTIGYYTDITGLAYEPCENKVFVSCGGLNCGVNMYQNGNNIKFPHPFKYAVAMTIDVVKHKLYVIEKNEGIMRFNYDGSCKKSISTYKAVMPYGLLFDPAGNTLMWSDHQVMGGMFNVHKININNVTDRTIMKSPKKTFAMKRMFDRKYHGSCPAHKTCETGVCGNKNGGCEQICSEERKMAKCYCVFGGVLRADNKTCDYSMVAYGAAGRYLVLMFGKNMEKKRIFHTDEFHISAIAHTADKKGIFFARKFKNGSSAILYREMNKNQPKVISYKKSVINSMAYDQQKDALYYAQKDGNIHRMHKPRSIPRDEFLLKAGDPRDLILSYCYREMIYVDMSNKFAKIMKIKDGQTQSQLINYGPGQVTLTFDRSRNKLYWYCAVNKVIKEVSNGFTCERTVATGIDNLKNMVYRHNSIYYDDGAGLKILNLKTGLKSSMMKSSYPITVGMKMFYNQSSIITVGKPMVPLATYSPMVKSTAAPSNSSVKAIPTPTHTPAIKDYVKGPDGYHYKFYAKASNWSNAAATCKSEGASLAVFDTPEKYGYLKTMISSKKYTNWIWIGGRDKHSNGTWRWENGKPVKPKLNWYPGEPNNYNYIKEDCMAVYPGTGAFFYDAQCGWADPNFVCQKGGYVQGPSGHYFKLHDKKADWNSAQTICKAEGGHLAVLDTPATFEFVRKMISVRKNSNWIWIGGQDKNSNGTWNWLNGKSVGKSSFWEIGQPNNYNGVREDCMVLYPMSGSKYHDAYCLWAEPNFVCQRKAMEDKKAVVAKKMDGYKQGYDGNFYKYFAEHKTYDNAQKQCVADKAMLAMDDSDDVHRYMSTAFPQNYWHGVNDKEIEYVWRFVDGRYVKKTYWATMLDWVNYNTKDCAFMADGKWKFDNCAVKKTFLCQRKGSIPRCGSAVRCPPQILYPFGLNHGDNALPRGDETYARLQFESGFPFFSRRKGDLYIHVNGLITADMIDGRSNVTRRGVNVAAVYMMDLTTEHGGDVFYRVTTDKMILAKIAFEASKLATIPKGYNPISAVIVTWYEVSSKKDVSKKFTFQEVFSTDGKIQVSLTVYAKLDGNGGMGGHSEGKGCNERFNPESYRLSSMSWVYSSNIGIDGIFVSQMNKPSCGILKENYPVNVKYKVTDPSKEAMQSFYYNGKNKVINVFTQAYTWNYASMSFVTSFKHVLDEVQVKYMYYVNVPSMYKFGVSTLVVRDHVNKTNLRRGNLKLPMVWDERKCHYQKFAKVMDKTPCVLLNVMAPTNSSNPLNALTNVWLKDVTKDGFHVCYKGMVDFWSPRSISVDFMAVSDESYGATEMGMHNFKLKGGKNKVMHCKNVHFKQLYPEIPAVFVTAEEYNSTSNGEVMAVIKDVKRAHFVACVRSSFNMEQKVRVHYTVYGKTDKCSKFPCFADSECQLDASGKPFCGCKKNCTDYPQETFCATNLFTYKSKCEMEKHMCELKINATKENIKMAYLGMCKQYPYQTGETKLDAVTGLKTAFCKIVKLDSTVFGAYEPVNIFLTVTWKNQSLVHDASASWSEDVTTSGFKACVMVAGRHFFDNLDAPSVHWVAFQRGVQTADTNIEVGTVNMKTWYTGSRCHFIKFKKSTTMTRVLLSVEHKKSREFRNAMTAWVEKGIVKGYMWKICARELQNFDGVHENIKIHYMALHGDVDKYVVEPNEIHFERRHFGKDNAIPPVCKTVKFNMRFPSLAKPTVIVTAVNKSKMHTTSIFSTHDIAVWIQGNNKTHVTACFKSLRAGLQREEVRLQYAIWPKLCDGDWKFYDGHCFKASSQNRNHSNAADDCKSQKAKLPDNKMGNEMSYYFKKSHKAHTEVWTKLVGNKCTVQMTGHTPLNCSNSTNTAQTKPYVCVKGSELLTRGCPCMNNGTCVKGLSGNVMCQCQAGYTGKMCEKKVHLNCMKYLNMTIAMAPQLKHNVWYRYPDRKMVEYCPRRAGCASIDQQHPTVNDGVVTRNLVYGNRPLTGTSYCTKGYGIIKIQNCGDFYVYNLQSVSRKDLGTELCFERHTARK